MMYRHSSKNVYKKVKAKLSEDVIAPYNESTLTALIQTHPPVPLVPVESEVKSSILSFRNGTSGGFNSLRPQILKDLLDDAASQLLSTITSFMKVILNGKVPIDISPYFYGASLTALLKKRGGIRPIASGNVLRRIAAKIACRRVTPVLINLFKPNQLRVGIKNGAEAGAHAARIYFNIKHKNIKAFMKIDIKNAF